MPKGRFIIVTVAAALLAIWGSPAAPARADDVRIVDVQVAATGENAFRFDVTLLHGDEGWDHYADLWRVVGPDGVVIAERVLLHPHVDEQPFTRSLYNVTIDPSVEQVVIEARDSVHGWGATVEVTLPRP